MRDIVLVGVISIALMVSTAYNADKLNDMENQLKIEKVINKVAQERIAQLELALDIKDAEQFLPRAIICKDM